jgi:hypothetical protein
MNGNTPEEEKEEEKKFKWVVSCDHCVCSDKLQSDYLLIITQR